MLSTEASTSPWYLTSPPRSPSATAMAFRDLATSIPTKAVLHSFTARPPALRIGSAHPSNPRRRRVGRAAPGGRDGPTGLRTDLSSPPQRLGRLCRRRRLVHQKW